MAKIVQLNYDELTTLVKKFKESGEDYTRLHSNLRQRVQDLHKDWIGEGADKFFEEMEIELLPALERLAQALFFSQDVLHKIMKVFNEKDLETAGFFKGDFSNFINSGIGGLGGNLGGLPGGLDPADDFGASQFEQVLPPQQGGVPNPAGVVDPNLAPDDLQPPTQESPVEMPETQNAGVGAGGGVGGGNSSQAGMGDLKGMGSGVGAQTPAGVSGSGGDSSGAGQSMPDHVYEGTPGSQEGGGDIHSSAGSTSGGNQDAAGAEGAVAAGVAGIAGSAVAGSVAKASRGRKK